MTVPDRDPQATPDGPDGEGRRPVAALEPVPATAEVFQLADERLGKVQAYIEALVRALSPRVDSLVALSLSMLDREQSMTFTFAVSDDSLRQLDATQYLDDGPCVNAMEVERVLITHADDPLDEARWSLFARSSAHLGVRSTLSIPLRISSSEIASLNLYAADADAFDNGVDKITDLVHASSADAVKDADLSFANRVRAAETLAHVQDQLTIDTAAGLLAQREHLSLGEAEARIVVAARRAGVPAVQLAILIIETASDQPAD